METTLLKGIVKWYSPRFGYDFIADYEGFDYFVHYTNIIAKGYKIRQSAGSFPRRF